MNNDQKRDAQELIHLLPHYPILLSWIISQRRASPCLIGISAPQGAGKTTLCKYLVKQLQESGYRATAVSIDDFYLTRQEQVTLAKTQNRFWQNRGYPGTHDIELGWKVLTALKEGRSTTIPRYDKSAFDGKGDRSPASEWIYVNQAQDFILLEGWMLGFRPTKKPLEHDLTAINCNLEKYTLWQALIDSFILMRTEDLNFIIDWRVEAEEQRKSQGSLGMTKDEVTSYVKSFMSAYEIYVPELASRMPLIPGRSLSLIMDKRRSAWITPAEK